jgi:hypothetical protein
MLRCVLDATRAQFTKILYPTFAGPAAQTGQHRE